MLAQWLVVLFLFSFLLFVSVLVSIPVCIESDMYSELVPWPLSHSRLVSLPSLFSHNFYANDLWLCEHKCSLSSLWSTQRAEALRHFTSHQTPGLTLHVRALQPLDMVRYNFSAVFDILVQNMNNKQKLSGVDVFTIWRIKHSFVAVCCCWFFRIFFLHFFHSVFSLVFFLLLLFIARIELCDVPFGVPNKLGLFCVRFSWCLLFFHSFVRWF